MHVNSFWSQMKNAFEVSEQNARTSINWNRNGIWGDYLRAWKTNVRFSCHNFWACSKICVNNHVLKGCEWVAAVSRSLTEGQKNISHGCMRLHVARPQNDAAWSQNQNKHASAWVQGTARATRGRHSRSSKPRRLRNKGARGKHARRGGAAHAGKTKKRGAARNKLLDWMEANLADKLSDNIFPSLLVMIYTIVAGNPF